MIRSKRLHHRTRLPKEEVYEFLLSMRLRRVGITPTRVVVGYF